MLIKTIQNAKKLPPVMSPDAMQAAAIKYMCRLHNGRTVLNPYSEIKK